MAATIRIFRYLDDLDAFLISDEYRALAERLGFAEWHHAVWIGRLFAMDNDFGEHWFDNWDEREALEEQANARGIDSADLMIVVPSRFADGRDGPCHPDAFRRRFWTEVLKRLELSRELLFDLARHMNAQVREHVPDEYIVDLEERIAATARELGEHQESERTRA